MVLIPRRISPARGDYGATGICPKNPRKKPLSPFLLLLPFWAVLSTNLRGKFCKTRNSLDKIIEEAMPTGFF